MLEQVRQFCEAEELLDEADAVIAGVSGGADSVCLFLLLCELAHPLHLRLCVVHVHHGIRGSEADGDVAFVQALCERYGVPCEVVRADVPARAKRERRSVEEMGRIVRHEAFVRCAREHFGGRAKIALAHHRDDVAETMLYRLARGTGLAGLAGIAPKTRLALGTSADPAQARRADGADATREHERANADTIQARRVGGNDAASYTIIRPLLCVGRAQIKAYLNECGVTWREDSTNATEAYARNRIRSRVLPELAATNAQAVEHMAATAQLVREVREDLTTLAAEHLAVLRHADGALERAGLMALRPSVRAEVVRLWLAGECSGTRKEAPLRDITQAHLRAILSLAEGEVGRVCHLPGGRSCRADYTVLRLEETRDIPTRAGQNATKDSTPARAEQEPTHRTSARAGQNATKDSPLTHTEQNQNPPQTQWLTREQLAAKGGISVRFGAYLLHFAVGEPPRETPNGENRFSICLNYDKISDICLRTRAEGDRIAIARDGTTKSVRRLLIDEKIPRAERERLPIVATRDAVLWVVGVRQSCETYVDEATTAALYVTAEKR